MEGVPAGATGELECMYDKPQVAGDRARPKEMSRVLDPPVE